MINPHKNGKIPTFQQTVLVQNEMTPNPVGIPEECIYDVSFILEGWQKTSKALQSSQGPRVCGVGRLLAGQNPRLPTNEQQADSDAL